MLGSSVLSVRLGGIYALQCLAEEYPLLYHIQIMRIFCAFVRHPTKDSEENTEKVIPLDSETKQMIRTDIQAVMEAIGGRRGIGVELEKTNNFRLDLRGANLSGLWLMGVNADLSDAILWDADLSNANLLLADLSQAILVNANLSGTALLAVNLSSANLSEATGLTQYQLNEARVDTDKQPSLEDAFDAKTSKPLEWRGRPLEDK